MRKEVAIRNAAGEVRTVLVELTIGGHEPGLAESLERIATAGLLGYRSVDGDRVVHAREAPVDRDTAILTSGALVGLAMRVLPEEFREAVATPGLTGVHRELAEAALRFREDVARIFNQGGGR